MKHHPFIYNPEDHKHNWLADYTCGKTVFYCSICGAESATMAEDMNAEKSPSPLSTQIGGNHYKDLAIQPVEFIYRNKPVEFIYRNKIGYMEGNIIKYTCRHRSKNGRQDLEKARHYLDMLIEMEYGEKKSA
jgi:hypothetical protein